ncbi:hypothetical protein ABFT23_19415 [Nocardioides sp. C4-1]|uniref:hypothetical protein n=1 Tax=Nocardioides sp. C4-1 TaxID=3151851 RepID=UPI003264F128
MTDTTQIEAAYERLTAALAVPAEADRLVAARVAVRRRRRRARHGVAAIAVAATTIGAAALVGGGTPATQPIPPAATATETTARPAPDRAADETPDAEPLCGLTGEEALRLVRQRYRDEHPGAHGPDDELAVPLADLSRAVAPCR